MQQKLIYLKGEVDKPRIATGDFNRPLSATNRTSRQKINKDIENMNTTINQHKQTDIYKTLHSKTEYTFFQMHMEHSTRETICWAMKYQYIFKI